MMLQCRQLGEKQTNEFTVANSGPPHGGVVPQLNWLGLLLIMRATVLPRDVRCGVGHLCTFGPN